MTNLKATLEDETIRRQWGYVCSPRQVWNSGFWDGHYDRQNQRPRRHLGAALQPLPSWSPFYRAGYEAGFDAASDGVDSTPEWEAFLANTRESLIATMLKEEHGKTAASRRRQAVRMGV